MKKKDIELMLNTKGEDFYGINIKGFHYKNIKGNNLTFHGKNLTSTKFTDCTFKDCEFINCNLSGSTFTNCKFINCDFSSSVIATMFNRCSLTNIDLGGCDFRGLNLVDTELNPNSLFNSCGNNDYIFNLELPGPYPVSVYKDMIQLNRLLISIEDFKNGNYDIKEAFPLSIIDDELFKTHIREAKSWLNTNIVLILAYIKTVS